MTVVEDVAVMEVKTAEVVEAAEDVEEVAPEDIDTKVVIFPRMMAEVKIIKNIPPMMY